MNRTIEQITSDVILQEPRTVKVNGKEYTVAPPSFATLIELSKYISLLPDMDVSDDEESFFEAIASAKDCEYLGDIAAILMLGRKTPVKRKWIFKKEMDSRRELALALAGLSNRELHELIVELFRMQEVNFFLSTLIFLKKIKMVRSTKTTASGQLSPVS
ncbi:MAG: hypothetical protein LBB90_08910 [Tannerella sp.]|jgi:hypothetical protein|nr:hypothetical protein [Tannerella sp.]